MEKVKVLLTDKEIKNFEETARMVAGHLTHSLEYAIKQIKGRRKTVKINITLTIDKPSRGLK